MIIGSLGDVPFVVASGLVRTFRDYSREGNGRWAKHDLIGQKPVLEFLGKDIEKISFKMVFRADQGINPEKEAQKLRKMRDNEEIMVLILDPQRSSSPRGIGKHLIISRALTVQRVGS